MLYQRLIFPGHTLGSREGRRSTLVRYVIELVAIVGLCAGLYLYTAFMQVIPQCALENHHGAAQLPRPVIALVPDEQDREVVARHLGAPEAQVRSARRRRVRHRCV